MLGHIIFILLFNGFYLAENPDSEAKTILNVESTKKDLKQEQADPVNITSKISNITDNININNNDNKIKINDDHSKDPWAAALRGFYVFLGLSILIIVYFIIKSFRLRPGAPPPAIVRKYGIVGRRSDMEMLPLPLVEEDDDDTVFDMGTQINR